MKIYDARENGGFLFDPPTQPCKASDECHGAGTEAPGPPNINTFTGAAPSRKRHRGTCPEAVQEGLQVQRARASA